MTEQKNQMQIADRKTAREWYRLIEDGVPQDKALEWLQAEATSATAPAEYRGSWTAHGGWDVLVLDTNGLTKAECLALIMYTSDTHKLFRKFNKDCRDSKWSNYIVFTSLLQTALCKRRRKHAENPVKLYRGTSCESCVKADEDVFMPSFASTTPSEKVAKDFGKKRIVLETSTCGTIAEYSAFPDEIETLIPPFQGFTVRQNSSQVVFQSSIEMTSPFLASPLIRGSLLGAVVGNCIGVPYEFKAPLAVEKVLENLKKLENKASHRGQSRYTADTSMTLALAESLTRVQLFDVKDISKSFSNAYCKDPDRNFGNSNSRVLKELHELRTDDDPFAPAKALFNGSGSHGNGGAMRIAPIALYYFYERENQFNEYVKSVTALTHSNPIAINGAILQATAVQFALLSSVYGGRSDDFPRAYIDELIKRMKSVELKGPYCTKLEKIKQYLTTPPTDETIRNELGTGISADTSVPTAIYCFLRGMKPIDGILSDRTEFERTVIYAISLGGDTDTIASMAGAIAGAYYGQDAVTQRWRDLCETKAIDDAKLYANKMISQLFWDGN